MSSDIRRVLRRLKPERRRKPLAYRIASALAFIDPISPPPRKLLYDTTVYIDILQGRFPKEGEIAMRSAEAWHSTVAGAELAVACGLLDPAHPDTASAASQIVAIIERRPAHRIVAPDGEVWVLAGVLSGTLARLQSYSPADRRRV
ncbi:MAG: hypothetical protein ACREUU_15115, partial [Gammaproteobacteria bacterium]